EIAVVGFSREQAEAVGVEVQHATVPLAALGRAATMGAREGFVRVLAERGSSRIVGAEIVGPHASELVAEATLAIEMAATPEDLGLTIHPHPTLSEGLGDAGRSWR